jgi:hypothetical protein
MTVTWAAAEAMTAADSGSAELPVRATWCQEAKLLEIIAAAGDTGIGLALYPAGDTVSEGEYAVQRDSAAVPARPRAAAAARWFSETAVRAYRADSGTVSLRRSGGGWAGTFTLQMQPHLGAGPVEFSGHFDAHRVEADSVKCAADSLRPVSDTGGS